MPKIAISYRRADSDVTGRFFDRLIQRYGKDSVFRDIDSIPFGIDFRKVVNDALRDTDVLIAIVGPNWRGSKHGKARIDEDNDLVRIEVETALQRAIPVIPVLVGGALMPQPDELPETLREFSFRNGPTIDSGRNFENDVERLIRSMDGLFEGKLTRPGTVEQSAAIAIAARPRAPNLSIDDISEPTADEGVVYVYKPAPKDPTWEVRLRPDGLEFTDRQNEGRIFYDQIVSVLLTYKQVGMRRMFFTDISSRDGVKLLIASVSFEKGGSEYKDGAYGRLIRELHRRIERAGAQASFQTGSRPSQFWSYLIVHAVSASLFGGLTTLGLLTGSFLIVLGPPLLLITLGIAFQSWPNLPRRYQPGSPPERFVPRGY